MSTENDVPLGEGSRHYYERVFGERIRQINKSGSAQQPDNGGSNNNGRLGCGVLIAIFFLIRAFSAFLNSHSHTATYSAPPPPPPPFKRQQPIVIDHPGIDARDEEERRLLEQLLKERAAEEEKPIRIQPGNRLPEGAKR